MLGTFLRFEVCRSENDPNNVCLKEKYKGLKKTAAISLELINESKIRFEDDSTAMSENPTPDVYLWDSWFTSMDVVSNVNRYYGGNLQMHTAIQNVTSEDYEGLAFGVILESWD